MRRNTIARAKRHLAARPDPATNLCTRASLRCLTARGGSYVRLRLIFYARPRDEAQLPKSVPDYESLGAAWVALEVRHPDMRKWQGGSRTVLR